MSEIGELFSGLKAHSQAKRAANRAASYDMLVLAVPGVEVECKNDGAHLIVRVPPNIIDFWPGTGLWIVRGQSQRRRGVYPLLDYIKDLNRFGSSAA